MSNVVHAGLNEPARCRSGPVRLTKTVLRRIHRRAWQLCAESWYRYCSDMAADVHEGFDPTALDEWRPRV